MDSNHQGSGVQIAAMRINLGWRLVLFGLLFLLVSYVFVGLVLAHSLDDFLAKEEETALLRETRLAAKVLSYWPPETIRGKGDGLAESLAEGSEARVTIIDREGTVLGDSYQPAATLDNHLNRPEVQTAITGTVGIQRRYSLTEDQQLLYVAVPVEEQLPVNTIVRFSLPLTSLETFLATTRAWLLIGLGGGFLIFLLLSLSATGLFTRPIRRITQVLRNGGEGLFELTRIARRDEIGSLARQADILIARWAKLENLQLQLEQKLSALMAEERDGLITLDLDGKILTATAHAQELLGLPEHRLLGKTLLEATLDHRLEEAVRLALQQHEGIAVPLGKKRLILRVQSLAEGSDRTLVWLIDRTEIETLQQVRQDFIANVGHELKTPIASIRLMMETIVDQPSPPAQLQRDYAERCLKELGYLQSLVENLSKLSSIETGKMEFNLAVVDLRDIMCDLEQVFQGRAARQGLEFRVTRPESPLLVSADIMRLREACLAILDNAFKFTPAGRGVFLQATTGSGWVSLQFRDEGQGIPAEELPRIFERFYKVDKGRASEGFGIGLALAKHIVESFGGTLSVISDVGKGALFILRLPLANSGKN
jgi:two-component system phosphate regulon sensor histidine kinase PhoR